jgi:hypothetical protein
MPAILAGLAHFRQHPTRVHERANDVHRARLQTQQRP